MSQDERLFFKATQRNKNYIEDVLSNCLPPRGTVLEIASGSGEHGVIFQKRFPKIIWQTSDPEYSYRKSISAWISHQRLTTKMPQPIDLDVMKRPWHLSKKIRDSLKGIVCINMIHISPWNCTRALFEESDKLLKKEQFLLLYGPFKIDGMHISKSNALFDENLKSQNSSWGVRDIEEVCLIARQNKFHNHEFIQMPANNLSVIFRKK
tara:strand:- start:62 stop:685 length:624 start_codon:yes stop_codon:yes gene_type:complete